MLKSIIRHTLVTAAALSLMLGLPYFTSDYYKAKSGSEDAVAAATQAIDSPSGKFVVLVNKQLHTNSANLSVWQDFFENGESDDIYSVFEDITCYVSSSDPTGLDMAKSFQSRLPENQMKIKTEDTLLMLSKAENGKYDIIIMSSEMYDKNKAYLVIQHTDSLLINTKGE
ncbi:MAG: hypothetical protein IJ740_10295 [Ruminococcus sp.]|nr:hypothetical protein [Ruminococcus sp.]